MRVVACVLMVLVSGCVAAPRTYLVDEQAAAKAVGVAVLPFENFTENKDAAGSIAAMFLVEMLRSGVFELADPALVEKGLQAGKVRDVGAIDTATIQTLGRSLKVQAMLMGAIVEYANRKSDGREVPIVGVSARLVDTGSGKIIWVGSQFRDGSDRETVFGFGRETSPAKIAQKVVNDLVGAMAGAVGKAREQGGE